MSKRFESMKEFGRSMKKPKLDLTIGSRAVPTDKTDRPSTSKSKSSKSSLFGCCPSDFWDDDDDDVILLATQVAEKEHCVATLLKSFSEFANVGPTSTQTPIIDIPAPEILSQIFEDDFDLVGKKDPVFKKPATPPAQDTPISSQDSTNIAKGSSEETMEFVLSQTPGLESTLPTTQSTARRQLASERQIKFLMEKVDALKKENSTLTKDLADTKSRMASKEGETSLLRDELRHLKQQAQTLKMEKMLSAKAAQNECQSKIDELEKEVEAKEAEIKMKELECSMLKMRHGEDTQRLNQSLCEESIRQLHIRPELMVPCTTSSERNKRLKLRKCLMKMQSLDLNTFLCGNKSEQLSLSTIHPSIFEHALDKGSSKKQRTLFQLEFENIQTLVAQLHHLGADKLPENFINRCINSICKVLLEFWSYTHSLEFPKNCRIYPYHGYSLINTKVVGENHDRCLQQHYELYDEERCISLRRYIAALSIIFQQVPALTSTLLEYKHGEHCLLQIAIDSVAKLGFAREICEHFGVLEAFAVWLNSMLTHVTQETSINCLEMLVDFMKHLVFIRPSAWIFREISIGLRQCCRLPNALDMLCINSSETTFVTDRVRSTYRFSNDSCFMQVYCGLLEIAFPLSSRLNLVQLKLLAVICLNHVRFVYHCFQKPPKFVQKLLFYDDEEDDNDSNKMEVETNNSTASTSHQQNYPETEANQRCECYIKLCLSVVTLIFQLLRQWLLHKKEYCTLQVAEISKVSVQILHNIFCDNYTTCLFRESEETTKHYLSLITKWWFDNSKLLQFDEINLNFLDKLQKSHVLPKRITAEINYKNIVVDLCEWKKSTNDNFGNLKVPTNAEEAYFYAKKLNLIEDASNKEKFFENLQGFAFNFQ